jgi:HlyD family type I secretion membrane fusion protein
MRSYRSFLGRESRPQPQLLASGEIVDLPSEMTVPDWRRPAIAGYALIVFTFVVLGGWSAYAELDSSVSAPGVVSVETNRKTVQHLEGGIIEDILVREGQRVEKGQVLFKLDKTQALASQELNQKQLDYLMANEARLVAERDGAENITFPEEFMARRDNNPTVALEMIDQANQFKQRRASLQAQISVLQSKINQYDKEIDGLVAERESTENQLHFIKEELVDLKGLFSKSLVSKSRVLQLEREKSRLEGVIGRLTADQAKAENGKGETSLQMHQLRQKFMEEVAGSINDFRQKIAETREKLRVAKDVMSRIDIIAPVSGTAQNLHVFTKGGVIRAGEPLVDIVPEHEPLIIQARVSPEDINSLQPGMQAEIRFPSFHTSILPIVLGEVQSVSRDRLIDEQSKQPYFLAQVIADEVPEDIRSKLSAGMPADVIFPTGQRTVLAYLVRPLKERMRHVMREK